MMCTRWDYGDRLAPLDLLRCMAPSPAVARFQVPSVSAEGGDSISIVQVAVASALEGVPEGSEPNENLVMMAARTIANLFKSGPGQKVFAATQKSGNADADAAVSFIERVIGIGHVTPIGQFNRNLLVALTTASLNLAVLASKQGGALSREAQIRLLDALARVLGKQSDGEVVFRALVATGTLITVIGGGAPEARSLRDVIRSAGDRVGGSDDRIKGAVAECLELLR